MNGWIMESIARQWTQDRIAEAEAWRRARRTPLLEQAVWADAAVRVEAAARLGEVVQRLAALVLRGASVGLAWAADRLDPRSAGHRKVRGKVEAVSPACRAEV
ncbi:hypothetical protein [Actinopolymorpha sp. B9G3]|uniref:hypothetical protein n=1 Tax=Actinopolymorpha sp. B9G3 TaxID=3158970 RepID=UPI0032D9918E